MPARVTLGSIVAVFGVRGWVRARSYARPESNLLLYRRWWLSGEAAGEYQLLQGQAHGRGFIAHLASAGGGPLGGRDQAVALVGARIEVERAALPVLPRGQYYWADLIGLKVQSLRGEPLGVVDGLTDNGAQDVLVVEDDGRVRLIPFVRGPIVKRVEPSRGRIVVDWAPDY
ncbi:MAG: 16S rRNA processing protein RimM [Gammaproteobacteria bacterium]|nr:16S rRNA processing protein RimM [Gammaproteobacteria bacterium]